MTWRPRHLARARTRIPLIVSAALTAPLLLASPSVEACGGLFCDNFNLPEPMPVDQNSEDILFVVNGDSIEVHVRITYVGEAERFAWVVPIQAIPEVDIGSDALFNALRNATGPQWSMNRSYECEEDAPPAPKLDVGDPWDSDGVTGDGDSDTDDGGGGPQVVLEETVGAFEVVVLEGGTAQEVIDFLNQNDYAQDPEAEPILQEYLDEGFLFAAVKLTAEASVNEIHPIAFTFPGDEPCVPLRLTRIAALEDMNIFTYFLGEDRWAPSNYAHVVPNPVAFEWGKTGQGGRYGRMIGAAIDEAGGRGFVTGYAGSPENVPTNGIYRNNWVAADFINTSAINALNMLNNRGLINHPLVLGLLLQYMPPPDGQDPQQYYNNVINDFFEFDEVVWDSAGFAAELDERVIQPGMHAVELLQSWPTLTRLRTIMSPADMIEDPVFHANPDLPDVGRGQLATELILCGAVDRSIYVDLEGDAVSVCLPGDGGYNWPEWDMPAALRIEQVPMMGPPQVTTDKRAEIDALLDAHNSAAMCTSYGGDESGSEGGSEAGDEDGNSSAGDSEGTSTTAGADETGTSASCGCSTPSGEVPVGVGLGLLVLGMIGPWRRRD